MKVITTAKELRNQLSTVDNSRIVFVPTMGNLHEGHLSLVRAAKKLGDLVVVSIFVNPLQFGANEDLSTYPRTPEEDQKLLENENVDILFLPGVDEMYPDGIEKQVQLEVSELGNILEGVNRPGHFRGVATVVQRLFDLVNPDIAVFGKKDYQQLLVIREMVADTKLNITIVGQDTVREADGLAMSSRNQYLSKAHRKLAPALHQTLNDVAMHITDNPEGATIALAEGKQALGALGFDVDYLSLCRQSDLQPAASGDIDLVLLIAAKLGNTRLIDNLELNLAN